MKKKLSMVLVMAFMMLIYITCTTSALNANAEGVSVILGGQTLVTGYYWYDTSSLQLQYDATTAPDTNVISNYIAYDSSAGKMTVYGDFYTFDMSGIKIDGGTLILSGTGNLGIVSNVDGIAAITGTNGAGIRTEGFSGGISIGGMSNANAISGLTTVELETTSGEIIFYASKQSDAFIDAENVSLKGTQISFASNGEPNTFIKATGNIELISNNDMYFSGSYSRPLFVGSSVNLESTSGIIRLINNNNIVNGNLTMKAAGDIWIDSGASVTTGNLNITGAENIFISSTAVAVEGSITINNSDEVEIYSDTSSVCKGDADIWINSDRFNNGMTLHGSGDSPVVGGTLTVNPYIKTNEVVRRNTGSSAYTTPIVGVYPSAGMVNLEEYSSSTGGTLASYVCVDGVIYNTNQGTCEHPLVDSEGECRVCRSTNINIAELVKNDGTKVSYSSLYDAVADAVNGETVTLLHNCDAENLLIGITSPAGTTGPLRDKKITFNLGGYKLQRLMITTERALTIENGAFYGSINHAANDGKLTLKNLKGEIADLQWMPVDGVWLENSQLSAVGSLNRIFVEKISMDEFSVLDIKNTIISNYGRFTDVEEAMGGIKEFLPYGYQLAKKQPFPNAADTYNTVVDENGEIARNILLKYKRLTDPEAVITVDTSTVVYDTTSKTPSVTVSYDGAVLAANRNYRVTYIDNVNAGTATIHIEGIGVYHGSVDKTFVIDKAPQNAPTGIMAVSETEDGKNDGAITNVAATMEYSINQTSWTGISGDSISGLADGDYYIRYKETANYYASPATKITVHKGKTIISDNPGKADTGNTGAVTDVSQGAGNTSANNQSTNGVKTGDSFPVGICLVLMLMSGCSLLVVYRELKKNK